MADVLRHPKSSKPIAPTLEGRRNEARSVLAAPPLDFERARDLAGEMYDRSALPAPANLLAYLNGLAKALTEYPEPIAHACCDAEKGVTRVLKYRPEDRDVRDWCDTRIRLEQGFAQERSRPRQVAAALPPPPSPDDVARVRGIVKGISDRLTRVVRRNTEEELQAKAEEFLRQQLCEANASFSTPASAVAATEPGIAAKGEAKASARPAAAPSVFELDPADWNA